MLENKVVLITGASRGIGRCIAEEYALNGATVYANIRNKTDDIINWQLKCNKTMKGSIELCYFDIVDYEVARGEIFEIWKRHNRIDGLVNNAGVEYNENIGMIQSDHMKQMFEVNIIALIEITQFISRLMMRKKCGSIVNMASVVGEYGSAGQSVYSATKGAVIAFTKSAAKELGRYNLRVNAVAPGITDTDMVKGIAEGYLDKRIAEIPLKRMASPIEIARVCVFLSSDASSYISGQILGVNGGTTL